MLTDGLPAALDWSRAGRELSPKEWHRAVQPDAAGRRPLLLDAASAPADFAHSFTMDDVEACVEADFLDAGRGVSGGDASGWKMAQVSTPRGPSFAEAKMRFCDVQVTLTLANPNPNPNPIIPTLAPTLL